MKQQLFTPEPKPSRRGRCTDLVPRSREACILCGGPVRVVTMAQPALFMHGGYGATQVATFAACNSDECRGLRLRSVTETRPEWCRP